MRRGSSRAGAAALVGLLLLAVPAAAQETDFFDQAADYFKSETIEGVSKHAEAPTETPATVTIVGREDIERYGFRTVADVLSFASVGGFVHWDRRYELAGSRGLFFFEDFNTRLLVMLNGHPVNEPWASFGAVGRAMLVPLDLVERVEIVYGPSSLLYGGYSLYGIVNVVTRTGGALPGWRARASAGSWKTGEGVVSFGASGVSGATEEEAGTEWSVLAAAGYYASDGEQPEMDPVDVGYPVRLDGGTVWGGEQEGSDFERSPFVFVHARRGDLSFMGRAGFRRRAAPFAPYGAVYGEDEQTLRDAKAFVEARWDHEIDRRLSLTARVFHDVYGYDESDPYSDSASYPGEAGYRFLLSTSDHDSGAEVRASYRRGTHFLTVGGEARYRTLSQESSQEFLDGRAVPGTSRSQDVNGRFAVIYVQEEWRPRDKISLVLGGNFANTDPGGSKAQPRVAVIFKPRPSLSVKALYGRGFRPPSIFEASYRDFQSQIDNPALESEQITSTELSTIWNVNRQLALQAYAFRSKLLGLIQGVDILSPEDVEGGVVGPGGTVDELVGLLQYQSTGDVLSKGVGASLRLRMRHLRAYANVAWSDAELERPGSGDDELAGSPAWVASAGASYDWRSWTGGLSLRYLGPHRLHSSWGGEEAGDFAEANFRLAYRTRIVYPVTLRLDVRNLLDSKGEFAASQVYPVPRLPIEGRRLLVSAEAHF